MSRVEIGGARIGVSRPQTTPRGPVEVLWEASVMRQPSERAPAACRGRFPTTRGSMSSAIFDVLRRVTTATITTMLLKKGIRRCWMHGPKPLVLGGERIVGPAFQLRFVPVREDLATPERWASPISTRAAIE